MDIIDRNVKKDASEVLGGSTPTFPQSSDKEVPAEDVSAFQESLKEMPAASGSKSRLFGDTPAGEVCNKLLNWALDNIWNHSMEGNNNGVLSDCTKRHVCLAERKSFIFLVTNHLTIIFYGNSK